MDCNSCDYNKRAEEKFQIFLKELGDDFAFKNDI